MATYILAPGGDFTTIAQVNAAMFLPDDVILVQCGQTLTGKLIPPSDGISSHPITFIAYGVGAPPVILGDGSCALYNAKSYIQFFGIIFNDLVQFQEGGLNPTMECCIARGSHTYGVFANGGIGTLTLNNVLISEAYSYGLVLATFTLNPTVNLKNSQILGNATHDGYGVYVAAGTLNYDYNLIAGNRYNQEFPQVYAEAGATVNDGGHNKLALDPKFASYPSLPGECSFSFVTDDFDESTSSPPNYNTRLAAALNPLGVYLTHNVIGSKLQSLSADQTALAALVAAGNKVGWHSWSHTPLDMTTAFGITSVNPNPTINVDLTGHKVSLHTTYVINPSFELGNTGWDEVNAGAIANLPIYFDTVPDGANWLYANTDGSASQVLSTKLIPGDYSLTVYVGRRKDVAYGGATVALYAGSTLLASSSPSDPGAGNWALCTVTYHAAADDPNLGQLLKVVLSSAGVQSCFDKVGLTGPDLSLDWTGGKTIADLKSLVAGNGWTITNSTNVQDQLTLASLADSGGAQAVPYTANLNINNFWQQETDMSLLTSLGLTLPTTMAMPGDRMPADPTALIAYLKNTVGYIGARMSISTNGYKEHLDSINIYQMPGFDLPDGWVLGDGSEAQIRANARNLYIHARMNRAIYVFNPHNDADITPTQAGWLVDELQKAGAIFKTFEGAINSIKADHSSSDGITYTKTYTDHADFRLTPGPCVSGGIAVGLTKDIAGKTLPRPWRYGSKPDVGAYAYDETGLL